MPGVERDPNAPIAPPGESLDCEAETRVYPAGVNHQEGTVPKGTPRTDAEKRADELLNTIESYMRELRRLVSAGADAQRRLEKVRAELGYTGATDSALQPEPVWQSES